MTPSLGLAVFAASIALAWGQSASASLSGTVLDPSGAAVPDAKASLFSADTGVMRSFLTSENGQFVFPVLEPGHYQLHVQRAGFKLYVRSGILVHLGQAARLNVGLEISSEPQLVVVEDRDVVNDAAGGLHFTLSDDALQDMPMLGRNFQNLAGTAPGTAGRGSLADFDNFSAEKDADLSANGRGSVGNVFLLDGLNVTSNIVLGVTNLSPNPDSIQQFTVQTNAFTVEQGRSSSLQVSMITRGGTNRFHGTASYFFSDQHMLARTVFTDRYEPFKKNTLAATFGGPIVRNKAFFFTSVEALRSNETQAAGIKTFESPEFVAFAKAAFPNSLGTRVLAEAPIQNVVVQGVARTAGEVFGSACGTASSAMLPCDLPLILTGQSKPPAARNGLQNSFRLDRYFRESRDRVFGNYYRTRLDLANPAIRAGTENTGVYGSRATELAWTHTFSATLLNEASFSGIKVDGDSGPRASYHLPEIQIGGQSVGISPGWGGAFAQHNYNWRDVLIWVRGSHTLKAGGDYYWSDDSADFTRATTRPTFFFPDLIELAADRPHSETGLAYGPDGRLKPLIFGGKVAAAGVFVQDEWHPYPNLTLTLGMRWDDFGNPAATDGMQYSQVAFAPGGGLDQQVAGAALRSSVHPYPHRLNRNYSPRVGVAWSPRGAAPWTVRGGIGLYQDWISLGQSVDPMRTNPPGYVFPTLRRDGQIQPVFSLGTSDTYPYGFQLPEIPQAQFDSRGGLPGARPDIGFLAPGLTSPHTLNYLLALERRLPGRLTAAVNYSGSYTWNALVGTDINRAAGDLLDGTLDRLNPSFGAMNEVWNGNAIHYNALIATMRREAGRALFQASYVFSKTTDYVQAGTRQDRDTPFSIPNQHDIRKLESYADWDVRHRFSMTGLWRLWRGWELTAVAVVQSGTPFSVVNRNPFGSGDYNADGYNYDFPDAPLRDFTGPHTRRQYLEGLFSAADFPVPAPGSDGTLKRNLYRNPGLLSVDTGLIKNNVLRALGERGNVQLRVEAFNVLNRVNLGSVDNALADATFGRSTSSYPARTIQAGLRIMF